MYHFYRIEFQFLTDSTDFKKPCERKAKKYFCSCMQNLHICKICVYANHFHVYRVLNYITISLIENLKVRVSKLGRCLIGRVAYLAL